MVPLSSQAVRGGIRGCRRGRRAGVAEGAAIVEARLDGAAAAAVVADAAGIVEDVVARGDVDEAYRAHTVLGRQRAGDQRHAADQARIQNTAEAGDAVRQHDAIDAELHVGMIVAHVDRSARGGILRHARRLQQDLLDRGVGALRQRLDGVVPKRVRRGAGRGEKIAARGVEGIVLHGRGVDRRGRAVAWAAQRWQPPVRAAARRAVLAWTLRR